MARGPLRFRVTTDKKSLDLLETLSLRLEAQAPEGVAVELPKLDSELGAFLVADYRRETPRLQSDGSMLHAWTYVLEPLLAEVYELPSLTARFSMPAEAGGEPGAQQELSSEAASIEVLMPSEELWEQLDIDDSAELSPSAQSQPKQARWPRLLALAAGSLLLLALLVWLWRRRRPCCQALTEQLPAHVKALAALQALLADDLVAKGEIDEFYYRLSGILRQYIEERFGLRAPEQTTEEFLATLRQDASGLFSEQQRSLLEQFLRHCDMVKFAKHRPTAKELQSSFEVCKQIVVETMPAALDAPSAPSAPSAPAQTPAG